MQASCQCGDLTAAIAEGAEPMVIACHCLDCQKRTGSPFGQIAYYDEALVEVAGAASEFSRPCDSGHTFTTGFCPRCGSTVYARASQYPAITGVTVGTFGDPGFPAPLRSVYEQSKHRWLAMPEASAGFLRGRDGERSR
jgi:hypothetical protein